MPRGKGKAKGGRPRATTNTVDGLVSATVKALGKYSPDAQGIILDAIRKGVAEASAPQTKQVRRRRTKAEMQAAADVEAAKGVQDEGTVSLAEVKKAAKAKGKKKGKGKGKAKRPSVATAPTQDEAGEPVQTDPAEGEG